MNKIVDDFAAKELNSGSGYSAKDLERNMNKIVDDFAKLNLNHTKKKVKVGVVGEIYVKYAPAGQ